MSEKENKKILDEIDELDADTSTDSGENFKISKNSSNKENILIILILILIIIIIMLVIFWFYNKQKSKLEEFDEYLTNTEYDETNYDETNLEEEVNYLEDIISSEDEDNDYVYNYDEEAETAKFEAQRNNITIVNSFKDIYNNIVIQIKNQNTESISGLSVDIVFFDTNNKPIAVDYNEVKFLEINTDYYLTFSNIPKKYEKYELVINKEDFEEYESYANDITFESKEYKSSNEIAITGKNNSSKAIESIEFNVKYYDENNNILYLEQVWTTADAGEEFLINDAFLELYDNNGNEVKYSRYEVELNSAYSYK